MVERVVLMLAGLLAGPWQDRASASLRILGGRIGPDFARVFLDPGCFAKCIGEPRGPAVPEAFHDPANVPKVLKANWARGSTGPQTFV